ncbi:MAG: hypothetical protein KJ620_05945 [Candidatus Edwardsbacteria bacterium]|nr:hypothetical protein [Candidatus Edwardsbacteria bacterium]MBU1575860.1 hypothetical protein [Candidatus Edwardsbacteria bacterium]MBU2463646.1 hypothetical protein [Candidatus Edwardsbacteria bacterium]MBU2593074.1 hypothetical protein [Candidatus Edwardsbacteria bacterium]
MTKWKGLAWAAGKSKAPLAVSFAIKEGQSRDWGKEKTTIGFYLTKKAL